MRSLSSEIAKEHERSNQELEGEKVIKEYGMYVLIPFGNLNRTDTILSSSEAEDMQAAACSVVETTSWMDWWSFAMKSVAL